MVKMQGGVFGAVDQRRLRLRTCLNGDIPGMPKPGSPAPPPARSLEAIGMTKRFGPLAALDDVSIKVEAGSFHALLGENGAGKSTLVKCIMGFYSADQGRCCSTAARCRSPRATPARNGIGMVYQHFTWCRALTAAENLVISRADAPG
jgi:ABC-type uncharacterized transport system ATPase subunit